MAMFISALLFGFLVGVYIGISVVFISAKLYINDYKGENVKQVIIDGFDWPIIMIYEFSIFLIYKIKTFYKG